MDPDHEIRNDSKERGKIYEFIVELFGVAFISVRVMDEKSTRVILRGKKWKWGAKSIARTSTCT